MVKRTWSKLFAVLMVMALVVGMLPGAVSAGEHEVETSAASQPNSRYPEVNPIHLNVVDISSHSSDNVLLDDQGDVYVWGIYAPYGIETQHEGLIKLDLPGKAIQIARSNSIGAVLLDDGTVYVWGSYVPDSFNPSLDSRTVRKIDNIEKINKISVGNNHALMLTEGGEVYSFGHNYYGSVGNQPSSDYTPTKINGLKNVVDIFAPEFASFAVLSNGKVMAWGNNYYNALQLDPYYASSNKVTTPRESKFEEFEGIQSVFFDNYTYLVVDEQQNLWGWGNNTYKQLGLPGSTAYKKLLFDDIADAGLSRYAGYIVKNDSSFWVSGTNLAGALGIDSDDQDLKFQEFTTIEQFDNCISVETSASTVFVLMDNGDVWAWGGRYATPYANYDYYISPILVFTRQATQVERNTVTLTETYADASQPDTVTPYTVNEGDPLTVSFDTPEGYTASVESDEPVSVDYDSGTITIDSVTRDIDITITYTPAPEGDHNVTVIVRYLDGIMEDQVSTYWVEDGAAFSEPYEVLDGYGLDMVTWARSTQNYHVDTINKLVSIASVTSDVTVLLEFEPIVFNVTVIVNYLDGALEETTERYTVPYGERFEATFEALDGYRVVDTSTSTLGVQVSNSRKSIVVDSVLENITVTVTLG